ncbi:hypothetical protein JNUCC0626_11765 [Lentzea sp. JNUCC 0626]|uniref:hypothetical protein n=1 Tax=Lentzea sp. JNUCC 0626 TaxID=3367513 RepID=UPI00374919F7
MRRVISGVLATVFAAAALVAGSGTASADWTFPPGQTGSTCTSPEYLPGSTSRYWTTCVHVTPTEVYFTMNFSNYGGSPWLIEVALNMYTVNSGTQQGCNPFFNFTVPTSSTWTTPASNCTVPRQIATYQGRGFVAIGNLYRDRYNVPVHAQ